MVELTTQGMRWWRLGEQVDPASYMIPPDQRRPIQRPVCICCCGPLIHRDADGLILCVRCGRPPR